MTLYTQPQTDVFASGAPPSEIQDFTAWTRGLGIAFDETNGYPEMTGLNGLFNAFNLYIKYLEQNGFAEWRDDMEYPAGAGVRVGLVWYRAKLQNTNKPPATSQTEWELFLNASALSYQEPLYIENNVIKISDASTTVKGVAQFANATEVATRANVSKAITPYNVGQTFESMLGANGSCRLPNGLILKWGLATGGNGVITFPSAFTSSAFFVSASCVHNVDINDGQAAMTKVKSYDRTSFSYTSGVESGGNDVFNPTTLNFLWFAIGY